MWHAGIYISVKYIHIYTHIHLYVRTHTCAHIYYVEDREYLGGSRWQRAMGMARMQMHIYVCKHSIYMYRYIRVHMYDTCIHIAHMCIVPIHI